jgi:hypothetical protein
MKYSMSNPVTFKQQGKSKRGYDTIRDTSHLPSGTTL